MPVLSLYVPVMFFLIFCFTSSLLWCRLSSSLLLQTGNSVIIDDVYLDPRFNREVDVTTKCVLYLRFG